jgi:hypothetical protein
MKRKKTTDIPLRHVFLVIVLVSVASAVAVTQLSAAEPEQKKSETQADQDTTAMRLKGGEEGTLFESLRIEGEDRVRIRFERPALNLVLDAGSAPGLEWKSIHDVIERSGVDPLQPFLACSAGIQPKRYARPWLDNFSTNGVARFQPNVEGVDRWKLLVADSKGDTVASFQGDGKPPKEIVWDGRSMKGGYVPPGLVYSYVLEAYDRAGNKRSFVGDGFELPAYRVDTDKQHRLLFSGSELARTQSAVGEAARPSAILLEVASWLNQEKNQRSPVRVEITAREFREAQYLADEIVQNLAPLLIGDELRIQPVTTVEPEAPEQGTVAVVVTR